MPVNVRPKALLNRIYARHKQWLAGPGAGVLNRANRRLDSDIESDCVADLVLIADGLQKIAFFHGVRAAVAFFERASGAEEFSDQSIAYWMWSVRMRHLAMSKSQYAHNVTNYLDIAANCLCYSIANDFSDWSERMAGFLVDATKNPAHITQDYWSERSFEPFALAYYRSQARVQGIQCGVYDQAFALPDAPTELAEYVRVLCDIHCGAMVDDGANRDPEFDQPPFDFVPWEILMLLRTGQKLDLLANLAHPLMDSHVNRWPSTGTLYNDDTLDRVCVLAFQYE